MDNICGLIFCLSPKAITLVAVILAFILIDDLSSNQQNLLANFLLLVGQTISTNAGNQQYVESIKQDEETKQMEKDIEQLKKELKELKKGD